MNASDAADYLARNQDFWTSTQILSHPEIARLAIEEVHKNLAADVVEEVGPGPFGRKRRKREEQERLDVLNAAAAALAVVHRTGLVQAD